MARGRFTMLRCVLPGAEAVAAESGHAFSRHTHERFGIGVIDRGAQKSLSGRGMVEAGAGDVITVNPGEVHDGMPIGDAGRSWRMLYLDPALVMDIAGDVGQTHELPNPVLRDAPVAAQVRALLSAVTAQDAPALAIEERLFEVLASILRAKARAEPARAIPKAIADARALIDDDPLRAVALADLARVSGLSRFQVLRAFARATGLTPHAYHVQRRIDIARGLIARGTALAEAALASGFADQSHMTRVFVSKYGVSPGAYAAAFV